MRASPTLETSLNHLFRVFIEFLKRLVRQRPYLLKSDSIKITNVRRLLNLGRTPTLLQQHILQEVNGQ